MKSAKIEVELCDRMGSDMSVVNAARVSFAKSKVGETDADDAKLIRYLAEHNHWSPFAHGFMSFRISAPIFVARQMVKHQIGLAWNEVSRRYVSDEPVFYLPKEWRAAPTGGAKQGSSAGDNLNQRKLLRELVTHSDECLRTYEIMLEDGVAPEMARMVLPLNLMTEWIWSGSLFAFARVCQLRLDPHAQYEASLVAQPIADHAAKLFPVSWAALMETGA